MSLDGSVTERGNDADLSTLANRIENEWPGVKAGSVAATATTTELRTTEATAALGA